MYEITGCSVEKQNSDRKNSVKVRFNVGAFIAVKLILNFNNTHLVKGYFEHSNIQSKFEYR